MKRINYLYYVVLIALWPLVSMLIGIGEKKSRLFLLLFPIYVCWLIFSQNLFYAINRKKPLKDTFTCTYTCKTDWSIIWVDKIHGELAALFMFNPFHVQYIPISRVEDARVQIEYAAKNQEYAGQISCLITIDGKAYKTPIATRSRYALIKMDGYGNLAVKQAQEFADQILLAKQSKG